MKAVLHWPATVEVDRLALMTSGPVKRTWRLVDRDLERDRLIYAPWWIAWLYRWLPAAFAWHGRRFDAVREAPYFLWSVSAPRWQLAWLPARRAPRYGARFGVLILNDRRVVL